MPQSRPLLASITRRFSLPSSRSIPSESATTRAEPPTSTTVIDTTGHTKQLPIIRPDTVRPDTSPTDTSPTDTSPTDTSPTDTSPTDTSPTDTAASPPEVADPDMTDPDMTANAAAGTNDNNTEADDETSNETGIATVEHSTELESVNDLADAAAPGEMVAVGPSTASVLTGELVSGLRSAGKHLSRPSASEGHLRTELTITARRIESLVRSRDAHDAAWALAAASLVHDAGCALEQRRITDGWQLVRAAQAELVEVLDHRELAVERSVLIGSSVDVLEHSAATDTEQLRTEVWALRQARNVHSAELERRLFDAARGLFHRGVMLLFVLVMGAVGVLFASPSPDDADALGSLSAYLTIVGLAMTGAAVSHTFFSNDSGRASAITETANPLHIVLLRLTFGGVVGLLVVVLLQADIQNLVNVTALSAYPWAIAGGMSERFVDRMIDRLEQDAHNAADATHSFGQR